MMAVKMWGFYRSNIDDGEDDHDNDKSDGSSDGDENNEGNNNDDRTYSVGKSQRVGAISLDPNYNPECHMQGLGLTYDHDHISQLDRSASASTCFSTYHKDDYNDDFVPHRNSIWKWSTCWIFKHVFGEMNYIMNIFWYV